MSSSDAIPIRSIEEKIPQRRNPSSINKKILVGNYQMNLPKEPKEGDCTIYSTENPFASKTGHESTANIQLEGHQYLLASGQEKMTYAKQVNSKENGAKVWMIKTSHSEINPGKKRRPIVVKSRLNIKNQTYEEKLNKPRTSGNTRPNSEHLESGSRKLERSPSDLIKPRTTATGYRRYRNTPTTPTKQNRTQNGNRNEFLDSVNRELIVHITRKNSDYEALAIVSIMRSIRFALLQCRTSLIDNEKHLYFCSTLYDQEGWQEKEQIVLKKIKAEVDKYTHNLDTTNRLIEKLVQFIIKYTEQGQPPSSLHQVNHKSPENKTMESSFMKYVKESPILTSISYYKTLSKSSVPYIQRFVKHFQQIAEEGMKNPISNHNFEGFIQFASQIRYKLTYLQRYLVVSFKDLCARADNAIQIKKKYVGLAAMNKVKSSHQSSSLGNSRSCSTLLGCKKQSQVSASNSVGKSLPLSPEQQQENLKLHIINVTRALKKKYNMDGGPSEKQNHLLLEKKEVKINLRQEKLSSQQSIRLLKKYKDLDLIKRLSNF